MTDLARLRDRLNGLEIETSPAKLRLKSRDFYWYSPVLKRQLDDVVADGLIAASSEEQILNVLECCYAADVPVTVRGGGSGNYGQAMPLRGGIVLDVSKMDDVLEVATGRARAQCGAKLSAIDAVCQAQSSQELRFHPSTRKMGTIAGFVAGGSSGIGSITWGLLRDHGNILKLRVATMEASPRIIELTGDDIHKVNHAYGTNGVITEVEMPLATAHPWWEMVVAFDHFMDAVRFADELAKQDALLKKLITPLAAPIPELYLRQLKDAIVPGQSVVLVMIADIARTAFLDFAKGFAAHITLERKPDDELAKRQPLFELSWNHTTLHALKVDPTITYLQVLYPPGIHLEKIQEMYRTFGDEVMMHLEFVRFGGQIAAFGLPIVRYTSDERLDEIIAIHERQGCPVFNPHAFTLEEGGMKQVDLTHLAFKREADPKGLLNPGKMIGWDNPDYVGMERRSYLYASAER
ncbi:MAG: FAD-binding oxidoreductase [Geminicoccaceae bacterium]